MSPPTRPRLAISAAQPPDGRLTFSTGVLRPPASTEHARQARRGHRVDRPRACAALATSPEATR